MVPSYQILVEIVWEVHYVVVMGLASDDATLLTWWGQVFEGSQDSFDVSLGLDYLGNSDTKKSFAPDTILFP